MNTSYVAEVVTFRLKPGTSPEAFTKAATAMTPFLRSTGAMISRSLSADSEGVWTEHILWTDLPAAQAAAKQMFARPEAEPFMAMIDQSDIVMRHADVALYLPPE